MNLICKIKSRDIQMNILEYLVYPIKYMTIPFKKELLEEAKRKNLSLLSLKYYKKDQMFSICVYNDFHKTIDLSFNENENVPEKLFYILFV